MNTIRQFRESYEVKTVTGMNQREFAKMVGLTPSQLSSIENGRVPSIDEALAIGVDYKTVRQYRESLEVVRTRCLTQTEFAKMAGISMRTLIRLENGEKPSFSTLQKIEKAFGKSIQTILPEIFA